MSYKLEDNPWSDDEERSRLKAMFEKHTKKDDKWIVQREPGDTIFFARWKVIPPGKEPVPCFTLEDVEWLLRDHGR